LQEEERRVKYLEKEKTLLKKDTCQAKASQNFEVGRVENWVVAEFKLFD